MDLFAQPVKLMISKNKSGKRSHQQLYGTPCGGVASILLFVLIFTYTLNQVIDLKYQTGTKETETKRNTMTEETSSIKLYGKFLPTFEIDSSKENTLEDF